MKAKQNTVCPNGNFYKESLQLAKLEFGIVFVKKFVELKEDLRCLARM